MRWIFFLVNLTPANEKLYFESLRSYCRLCAGFMLDDFFSFSNVYCTVVSRLLFTRKGQKIVKLVLSGGSGFSAGLFMLSVTLVMKCCVGKRPFTVCAVSRVQANCFYLLWSQFEY